VVSYPKIRTEDIDKEKVVPERQDTSKGRISLEGRDSFSFAEKREKRERTLSKEKKIT